LMGLDGITAEREGRQVVELLGELPDLWDVNVSSWSNDSRSSRFAKEGWQEEYVSFVKECTTKPVVSVGRFTSPDAMVSQVRRGIVDLIGAARPSIADPFLPRKIEEGRIEDIRECIGCNHCVKTTNHHLVAGCTQNPTMGEEWRLGWHPEHIPPKTSEASVLIVGAGPAGLEVTRALAQRGYQVTLAEASSELGGRVRRESALPGLQEWKRVADWRVTQVSKSPNVMVYRENRLSVTDILALEHDHVVLATGSAWRKDGVGFTHRLPIELHPAMPIFTPDDFMEGRLPEHGPVVVFDDDQFYMGGVLAELLRRRDLEVLLITPGSIISKYTEAAFDAANILARMRELGVQMRVHTDIVSVAQQQVTLRCLLSGQASTIGAAAVVMVTSRVPVDWLFRDLTDQSQRLADSGIRSVRVIGDARAPDTIAAAVFDGHRYAREFEGEPIDISTLHASRRAIY
jgi:dimethylamine/trimethylamine dehydrogenase